MPQRRKSMTTKVAETVMYIGMLAVVGHLAANFWERFAIKSELSNMKSSLHALKDVVNTIGTAYDNLYTELQSLATDTEQEAAYKRKTGVFHARKLKKPHENNIYDVYKPQDIQVQTMHRAQNLYDVGTTFEKTMKDFVQNCRPAPGTNVSTITKYPMKSAGVGIDCSRKSDPSQKLSCCIHRCYLLT